MKKYRYGVLTKFCLTFLCLVTVFTVITGVSPGAHAADETITAPSQIVGEANTQIPVDGLVIDGTGNDTIPVRLNVSFGTLEMSTTTGLAFDGPSSGATLEFSGTRSNVNAALATLTYEKISIGTDTLEISLTEPGEVVREDNGHIYEVVFSDDTNWTTAQGLAAASTKYGVTGYLATIADAAENAYIAERITLDGWIGASDADAEGQWEWVTGPEANTLFWTSGGGTVSGQYSNWNGSEPNDSGGNEDCGEFIASSGRWNDLGCSSSLRDYYIVEYGSPGNLPQV